MKISESDFRRWQDEVRERPPMPELQQPPVPEVEPEPETWITKILKIFRRSR
jgi:hypothetical protein